MKIALVHIKHSSTGGNEKFLNDASSFLADQGHEVTIICRRHEKSHHKNIKFITLKSAAIGSAHRSWEFAKAVDNYVKDNPFDIVIGLGKTYSQDILRLGAGLLESYHEAAHRYSRSPMQIALGRDYLKNKFELILEKKAFVQGQYKHIIANSKMVADDVKRRYSVENDKISVIYNGVDINRFNLDNRKLYRAQIRNNFGVTGTEKIVLFLGTNYGLKGLDRALIAFSKVAENNSNVKMIVVGYGKRIKEFQRYAIALNIKNKVFFAGGQNNPEAFYAAADLYVLPTRYDPFANATLEALASGLPVITTKQNGAHELLENQKCAWVLDDADSPEEFSGSINHFLFDSILEELRVEAITLASKHQIVSKMKVLSSLVSQYR